jgi:hypothetical protein
MIEVTVQGTFNADRELEGGCAWVELGRAELVPPPQYKVDYERLALVGPDGTVVAESGQQVTATGYIDPEAVSVCQLGAIFKARTVMGPDL